MSESFEWIDPDGTVTPLRVEIQTDGRYAPPSMFVSDRSPEQPGSIVRTVRHDERRIVLPIVEDLGSPELVTARKRELTYLMDPARGYGQLRVTSHDSSQRVINAYLEDGMGLEESLNSTYGKRWFRASLQFLCPYPYWRDSTTTSATIGNTGTTATFFPFFPLRLSSSSVFGSTTIDNTGEVIAYPRWHITGPGSSIYIKNLTTGKTINLDTTLMAGESVTIDTTPGVRTVTKNDGTNLFGDLSADSSLWPLVKGTNAIQLEMSSADANSSIQYSYERQFLGV